MDDTDTTDAAADAGGAVELALRLIPPTAWEGMFLLGKIATDPKAVRRHLRQLHDALVAITAGQDKLAAAEAAFAQYEQKTREELTAQAAKLREGQVALANAKDAREDRLVERERRISALEAEWKFIGEDNVDDVARGFRAAEFSSLMKARAAHGIGRDRGLDEIAAQMADWQAPGAVVRTGTAGESFPKHVSLTRTPEQPEPEAAAGARAASVRARYRRRANHVE